MTEFVVLGMTSITEDKKVNATESKHVAQPKKIISDWSRIF
jgi:hypothetical protein